MFNLYIGADNATGRLDRFTIREITSKAFKGFTMIDAAGIWQGKAEASIILQIETLDRDQVLRLAQVLKSELHQDAIGIQETPTLSFI